MAAKAEKKNRVNRLNACMARDRGGKSTSFFATFTLQEALNGRISTLTGGCSLLEDLYDLLHCFNLMLGKKNPDK